MSSESAGKICAYSGNPELTGTEDPEHAVPAAVNGRFTTYAVCNGCNGWAGEHIDQPWLDDPFVQHVRYDHKIPDRRGGTIKGDPFLTGMTDDRRHVALGEDGRPMLLNSPVERNPDKGEFEITAPDQETLDRMVDRELRKAGKTRDELELPDPQTAEDQPAITGRLEVSPGEWERIAAKMTLALLAEVQPEPWRGGSSADRLRERMRDLDRRADEVPLRPADAVQAFAPRPCTAVVVTSRGNGPAAYVSPLGIFTIKLDLDEDLRDVELAWVSDPLDPAASCSGSFQAVVAERLGVTPST